MLPKDFRLSLELRRQAPNPQTFLFALLDERTDVLRHLLSDSAILDDVLFMGLDDQPHLLEVLAVGVDFVHEAAQQALELSMAAFCCWTKSAIWVIALPFSPIVHPLASPRSLGRRVSSPSPGVSFSSRCSPSRGS